MFFENVKHKERFSELEDVVFAPLIKVTNCATVLFENTDGNHLIRKTTFAFSAPYHANVVVAGFVF